MRDYAARVVGHLSKFPGFTDQAESCNGVDLLRTDRFADGELEVVIHSSIRGKNVIVFTSSVRGEADISVDEAKIELYHTIDALKRSHAATITVFEPYVSSSRSDRTARRSSVGLWVHFKTLTSLGAQHIITYQLHSDKSRSMVDPTICTFDDIPALTLLMVYLCDTYIHSLENLENEVRQKWAFCSVDAGGEKIGRVFADAFGAPLVIAHKQRDYSRPNTVDSISILTAEPVKDKVLWVVDDMIDTASSVDTLIRALVPLEPKEINIMAVHALFSAPAAGRIAALKRDCLLNRVIVTDTVCCSPALSSQIPGLEVVSSAELSARIIKTIDVNASMTNLLLPFSAAGHFSRIK
jgi:ribose-phosphate pyrophosphokinase